MTLKFCTSQQESNISRFQERKIQFCNSKQKCDFARLDWSKKLLAIFLFFFKNLLDIMKN